MKTFENTIIVLFACIVLPANIWGLLGLALVALKVITDIYKPNK
jgi:hypothetical protein